MNDPALIHLLSTVFMAGVIVFVQVVHYPLMAEVGRGGFVTYEALHTRRTGWVVAPPMVLEVGSALWLVLLAPTPEYRVWAYGGLALLALIWGSTALLQIPAHRRLSTGFDAAVHRRLVGTNWVRTVAWILRVPLAVALYVWAG